MPGQLFVFYRPQDRNQALLCDVSYQENWQEDAFINQAIGTVQCPRLPELQLVRHQNPDNSDYFTINDGPTPVSVQNLNPGVPKFVGVSRIAGIIAANPFLTLAAMDEFFEKLRGEEPGAINPHGNLVSWTTQDGLWLGVDISWRRLLGHEASPLKDGLRGGEQGNLRDELTLDGFAVAIRPLPRWRTSRNTFKTVFGNIFAVLDPAIYVASTWGTPPRHAHSATADTRGSLQFIQAGLRLCFKPDAQLVHVIREHTREGGNPDVLLPWNIALGICGVLGEDRLNGEHVTFLDGSQPDTLDVTSPQAAGQVVAEVSALLDQDVSFGLRAIYHLPDETDGDHKFRWEHHGLEVGVMFELIGLLSHHDEWLPTIDDHVDIPAPQRPTEIAAPEPEPPRQPDQPSPPPEEPEFVKADLSKLVGWEEPITLHFKTGRAEIRDEEKPLLTAFARRVWDRAQPNKNQPGWRYRIRAEGHASTKDSAALNARLAVGRAVRGPQDYIAEILQLQRANTSGEVPYTPGLISTISRGEMEPIEKDSDPERTIPRLHCKPKEYSEPGCNAAQDTCAVLKCTLPGTTGETKLYEDRTKSKRVILTVEGLPPGVFETPDTNRIAPAQLAVDRADGLKVATALKGRGKFAEADYDRKPNVVRVIVTDTDLNNATRRGALQKVLVSAGKLYVTEKRAFSGSIEIIYKSDRPIANWSKTIDSDIADATKVTFPGGVVAINYGARQSLKELREQWASAEKQVEAQAKSTTEARQKINGIHLLHFALPDTAFDRTGLFTITKAVEQTLKAEGIDPAQYRAHLVVNDPTFETGPIQHAIKSANLHVLSVARGAAKDANTALGRKLYILIAPATRTDIDLSDKEHSTTIAIRNAMKGTPTP